MIQILMYVAGWGKPNESEFVFGRKEKTETCQGLT